MIKQITLLCAVLFLPTIVFGQESKVADFAIGRPNTKNYEHLSFWVDGNKRGKIIYSTRNRNKEIELIYLGAATKAGVKGFKVEFPNKTILFIVPNKNTLKITNEKTAAPKYFEWEYEGPANGRGTFCEVCAEEKESFDLIRKYFMKTD